MARTPSLYNQTTLSDDDFITTFVARHEVLDALVRRLRFQDPHDGGSHHLLIGPRGMGKTSMLRRLAIAIGRDEELGTRYVPLNFREEQYNVLRIGDFWRNCGEALAEWADRNEMPDLAHRLDADIASGAWTDDDSAAEAFHREMQTLGRRAVLLVDNLDLILENLSVQDNWKLRHSLQLRDGPIMVGAATQPLKQTQDRDAAFYEFFQAHHLDPLDIEETERCMRALAQQRGDNGSQVIAVLDSEPQRLRTLHTLTGGNPRILALIYRLLETSESDAAMADLEILLDQVTPYYKARIEEYQSAQQRAVIDAIALHWDPVTTGELARRTNIVTTTLSPVLIKLVKDGLIEKVETSGAYNGHQLVERFFNIWYLMRHGTRRAKQKMRWLVAFLTCFYSSRELAEIAGRARRAGMMDNWHADYASAFEMAIAQEAEGRRSEIKPDFFNEAQTLETFEDAVVEDLLDRAMSAHRSNDFRQALDHLDTLLARLDANDASARHIFVQAEWVRSQVLRQIGDRQGRRDALNQLVERFAGIEDRVVRNTVAQAELDLAGMMFEDGDVQPAIAILSDVRIRFKDDRSKTGRVRFIRALRGLAQGYALAGNKGAENDIFAEIEDRFGKSLDARILLYRAKAWLDRALRLAADRDVADAAALYRDAFARWADNESLARQFTIALLKGANLFFIHDEPAEALGLLDLMIDRYGSIPTDTIADSHYESVMVGKSYRAHLLDLMGDDDAAAAAFDEVIPRLRELTSPSMQVILGNALMNRATEYSNQDESDAELAIYDEVIERFAATEDPILFNQVSRAFFNRAVTFDYLGRLEEAAADYEETIARLERSQASELEAQLVLAYSYLADVHAQQGGNGKALEILQTTIARFEGSTDPDTQRAIMRALFDRGVLLDTMDDPEGAVRAFDELIGRAGDASDPDLRERAALAAAYKGRTLVSQTDLNRAKLAFEQAIELGRDAKDLNVVEHLAEAAIDLADILIDRDGDLKRAEELLLSALDREGDAAHRNLAWLCLLDGRSDDAVTHRSAILDGSLPTVGVLDAALELVAANFGSSTDRLATRLDTMLAHGRFGIGQDIDRYLRLCALVGEGERLIGWFETEGYADRAAPMVAAFKAYVRGAESLLDVNPEVRGPATAILSLLSAPRVAQEKRTPPKRGSAPRRKSKRT